MAYRAEPLYGRLANMDHISNLPFWVSWAVANLKCSIVQATFRRRHFPRPLCHVLDHGTRQVRQSKINSWVSQHASIEIEAVCIHDLAPRCNKIRDKLLLRVVLGIDFGDGTKLRV